MSLPEGIGARVIAAALILAAGASRALADEPPHTRTVVAGPQFARSGLHAFLFGSDYRKLWTTPIQVEVLDLKAEAGGLTPVRRVGGQQTKGLALTGKDGRNYTFRGLDKDATELVEEELRGTIVERTVQDQMAAQHPASEAIARVLLDAAGVPCPAWRLVVLPDDPALGEFRQVFAGAVGMFAEYPSAVSDTNPGFRGATEIIDHATLYKKLEAGVDQADAQALLRARLVDIFMGDWDRHRKQWRWAKLPGSPLWEPIPEDRDQAFCRYEGLVLKLTRGSDPRFQNLGPHYPRMVGLTYNGWEQDRRLLVGLSHADFARTALSLRQALTDDVLKTAVAAMPVEWRAIDGPRLLKDLRARRDALPMAADKYYEHLADRVDVYLTDRPERVLAKRSGKGEMELTVTPLDGDGKPGEASFHRVFHSETEDVRIYALGGNDVVRVEGEGGPHVRMMGGAGDDVLEARNGDNAKLSDSQGGNQAEGASLDDRTYVPPQPPKSAPWIPPRDWGTKTVTVPWLSYGSDMGVFIGYGVEHIRLGFRQEPYASRQLLRAGWAFGEDKPKAEYFGDFRRENRSSYWSIHAFGSGVETLHFYGYGNDTPTTTDADFFKVKANQYLVNPAFNLRLGKSTTLSLGPLAKLTESDRDALQFINVANPYGTGSFGELGVHGIASFDTRDSLLFTRHGVFLAARGTVFPALWDVQQTFGEANANADFFTSAGQRLTLAVRAGGKKVFGDYPYMEAAAAGGGGLGTASLDEPSHTVRGYRSRRFLGDASAFGNAELRLMLSRVNLILPAHWGLLGFVDSGRVWLEGEDSNTWHTGYGGGIWISILNYRGTISTGWAHSVEGNRFFFHGGFTF
jgi:hypothetical protein